MTKYKHKQTCFNCLHKKSLLDYCKFKHLPIHNTMMVNDCVGWVLYSVIDVEDEKEENEDE